MKNKLSVIFLILGCVLALGASICYFKDPNTIATGIYKWAYASAYSISLISLTAAYIAHKKQNETLEKIKGDTMELLDRMKGVTEAQGYAQTFWESSAMTELIKYAMFMAYTKKPFEYTIIYPKRPDIVLIMINTILSSYDRQVLNGHIEDGNILVIDVFATDKIPLIQDGETLKSKYIGRAYQPLIYKAVDSIIKATS